MNLETKSRTGTRNTVTCSGVCVGTIVSSENLNIGTDSPTVTSCWFTPNKDGKKLGMKIHNAIYTLPQEDACREMLTEL